jgi:acetyl-CoA carboxylase biotin carboxyl carrier protein
VDTLLGLVRGTRIAELEVEWDVGSVRVKREPSVPATPDLETSDAPLGDGSVVVTSNYVGVFHREPPTAFPAIGDPVRAGQTVAHVETLRIQNSVQAPIDGALVDVLVGDGTPVEYGQPVLVIQPVLPESDETGAE